MNPEGSNGSPASEIQRIVSAVGEAISNDVYGHHNTIRLLAGAFIVGGHVLLEGPPGIAKTLMAKSCAEALGLTFQRIQFTPDLMPSDVTGVNVFDQRSGTFHFSQGPVFADIVLADEINRTPPKTQSALLEAMQEHFVTIDGTRHYLSEVFFVIATQNPIEHEGTFPLPEAQLDRFLFKLEMTYPAAEFERGMIDKYSSTIPSFERPESESEASSVVTRAELLRARELLRQISLAPPVRDYIQEIAHRTRGHSDLSLGASPRAALHLALASKLQAAINGRDYVIPDDVQAVAVATLSHRVILEAELFDSDLSERRVIEEILGGVDVPDRVGM